MLLLTQTATRTQQLISLMLNSCMCECECHNVNNTMSNTTINKYYEYDEAFYDESKLCTAENIIIMYKNVIPR